MKKISYIFVILITILFSTLISNVNALSCAPINIYETKTNEYSDDWYAFTGIVTEVHSKSKATIEVTNNYSKNPINKTITIVSDNNIWGIDFENLEIKKLLFVAKKINDNKFQVPTQCNYRVIHLNQVNYIEDNGVIHDLLNIKALDKYKQEIINNDDTNTTNFNYLYLIIPVLLVLIITYILNKK